ncbi:MAG: VacJ family lipoprotein [Aestuariivita sp.]|nr:VacJ family lipoprotein [Aestuariivita sp.]
MSFLDQLVFRPIMSIFLIKPALLLIATFCITSCTVPTEKTLQEGNVFDPYERVNRNTHSFNRSFDEWVFRPVSQGYDVILPNEVEILIGNFATNASMPSVMVNSLLQADLSNTGKATSRFLINTTLGLIGFFDIASAIQIEEPNTDFGETLYVWGTQEGAYIELPFFGPATERSAAGKIIDLVINPLRFILESPQSNYPRVATAGKLLTQRDRLSNSIDSILYDSADSYKQLRLTYLQSRRSKLNDIDEEIDVDPYELDTDGF